ncbi:MAG: alpha/beta fold hydrolase [Thermoleophilaceae bacterium]|nr:alpha/beta fold hydrolase [Thermoleophilaceae bacterium]MBA3838893.1 alpha/beta fold hydrolase [Thermoleophilaceae bacterium]
MRTSEVIDRHRAAGREFEAAGVRSFVREEGDGDPVVCVHGVPSSCFLYRKVVAQLASRELRGVAFDLPGLGLAERPESFDYSWTGLGRFCADAVDALDLDRFHLLVHDIGGPIGFEVAAAMPKRVRSLTILNTMIDVASFERPWFMEVFARQTVGELWLKSLTRPAFLGLMYATGIGRRDAVPSEELYAYVDLLKRDDGGRAFLKIMRGFERTAEKEALYHSAVRDVPYPVQIVWGAEDPALTVDEHGESVRRAAALEEIHRLPSKHFLQEDQAPAIAERVAALAAAA